MRVRFQEGLLRVIDRAEWTTMTFDPDLQVNVRALIDVLRGRLVVANADQWEDMKEQIADVLEQFIAMQAKTYDDGK